MSNKKLPKIGFGTFPLKGKECEEAVYNAIKLGFRLIDSAQAYQNEKCVGNAIKRCIKESIIKREDIIITTKLSHHNPIGYQNTVDAVDKSLKELQLDYIDLFLIHWPNVTKADMWKHLNAKTWKAMEVLQQFGKLKYIGVSNFATHHLEELLKTAIVKPYINQLEISPMWYDRNTIDFCKKMGIYVEAYSPFCGGLIFEKPIVEYLAKKYEKTMGQIVLRWSIQKGFIPLPRTIFKSEMEQNLKIFDFELHKMDMETLDSLLSAPSCPEPDAMKFILEVEEKLQNIPIQEYKTIYLFGFLPLFKIDYINSKVYIFNTIPLLGIKALDDKYTAKLFLFGLINVGKIKLKW